MVRVDPDVAERMIQLIDGALQRYTIGGDYLRDQGVPVGLRTGFGKLRCLGFAMLSINAVKGFEYDGFNVSGCGSE